MTEGIYHTELGGHFIPETSYSLGYGTLNHSSIKPIAMPPGRGAA